MHLSLSPILVSAIVPLVLCSILERVFSVNPLSGWVGCPSLMVLGVADLDGEGCLCSPPCYPNIVSLIICLF